MVEHYEYVQNERKDKAYHTQVAWRHPDSTATMLKLLRLKPIFRQPSIFKLKKSTSG